MLKKMPNLTKAVLLANLKNSESFPELISKLYSEDGNNSRDMRIRLDFTLEYTELFKGVTGTRGVD